MNNFIRWPIRSSIMLLGLMMVTQQAAAHVMLTAFFKGDKPAGWLFALITVAAVFAAIAVHELGHLLIGLIQGFRFELFVVGLLGIKRTDNGIKVYLNKNIGYMGGVAATTPILPDVDNRKKFAWVVAAGPFASLLLGVLAIVLLKYVDSGTARSFWLVAGACSVGLMLATTLPKKTGIFFTDRARFQRLMSRGKASRIESALLSIMAQVNVDQSTRNVKLEHTQLLKTDDEAFMRFWGYYYEHQRYKDRGQQPETQKTLVELIDVKDTVPKQVWKMLKIDESLAS